MRRRKKEVKQGYTKTPTAHPQDKTNKTLQNQASGAVMTPN